MSGRNDPCWCGSGKKWKKCHFPEENPKVSVNLRKTYLDRYGILIKNEEQIAKIRAAGRLAAKILDATCAHAQKGVSTEELNQFAHEMHLKNHALPAPLGYGTPPFPKSICTSLNEVICHGIPGNYRLQEGDILNIDVTCILDGYYGDCSKMVMIGIVSEERKRVVEASYGSLMAAIEILKPEILINQIGDVISDYAEGRGCSVVNQFVGHGVGVRFHEAPHIPHHRNNLQIPLAAGMIFTIEPMINAGVREALIDKEDHWTARTADGQASAQWEHTLLITDEGVEILTPWNH